MRAADAQPLAGLLPRCSSCPPAFTVFSCAAALPAEGRIGIPFPPVKYDVRSFGARGDGATDDTPAIQRAVDAANARPGVINFPPGVYILSRPFTVRRGGVVLRGAGVRLRWAAGQGNAGGSKLECLRVQGIPRAKFSLFEGRPACTLKQWQCLQSPPAPNAPGFCPPAAYTQQGLTTLHIPVALGDVYPGTYSESGGGLARGREVEREAI